MEKKSKVLRKLFFSTLYLSTFTFGGGYVIVTLMKNKFVDELHWIDEEEMLDLVAIAQSSPGAIAVNGAIVVGYKLAGIPGVLCSILGAILPPMIILSLISLCYDAFRTNLIVGSMLKGMQSGVAAVIASVVYDMGSKVVKEKDWVNIVIMGISFIASYFFKVNVVLIIVVVACIGAVRTLMKDRRFQFRRRVRCHASYSEPGSGSAWMADDEGIHGSGHDCGDDAGADCGEFGNLCGDTDCGTSGRRYRHIGLYTSFLYLCNRLGLYLYEIPENEHAAGNSRLPPPCCCSHDRQGRADHPDLGGVPERRCEICCG